ncbi:MAG: hypothetical protein JKY43_10325 [Phycisphaerales bacterium]|nr:hypothetical protein [Phycisphaerales bacterium]
MNGDRETDLAMVRVWWCVLAGVVGVWLAGVFDVSVGVWFAVACGLVGAGIVVRGVWRSAVLVVVVGVLMGGYTGMRTGVVSGDRVDVLSGVVEGGVGIVQLRGVVVGGMEFREGRREVWEPVMWDGVRGRCLVRVEEVWVQEKQQSGKAVEQQMKRGGGEGGREESERKTPSVDEASAPPPLGAGEGQEGERQEGKGQEKRGDEKAEGEEGRWEKSGSPHPGPLPSEWEREEEKACVVEDGRSTALGPKDGESRHWGSSKSLLKLRVSRAPGGCGVGLGW